MQIYPRTVGSYWWPFPIDESPWFIGRVFFGYLLSDITLSDIPLMYHDKWFLLSPVVLLGVLLGIFLLLVRLNKKSWHGLTVVICSTYTVFLMMVFLQMASSGGYFVDLLHSMPVFASLRVFSRFIYILSLLLTMFAAVSLKYFFEKRPSMLKKGVVYAGVLVTLASFYVNNVQMVDLILQDGQVQNYDIYRESYKEVQQVNGWRSLSPVTNVKMGWNDVGSGSTGISCSDGLAMWADGANLSLSNKALMAGPVNEQRDGYFNMMKPACMLYPKENNCQPGDRIPISDTENFDRFRYGMKTDWRVSLQQRALNWLSFTWLAVCVVGLLGGGVYRLVRKARSLLMKK
jgi:hypothetical protein